MSNRMNGLVSSATLRLLSMIQKCSSPVTLISGKQTAASSRSLASGLILECEYVGSNTCIGKHRSDTQHNNAKHSLRIFRLRVIM